MGKKIKTKDKVAKIHKQLLSEDVVFALDTFTKNMKVVNMAYNKLKQISALEGGGGLILRQIATDLDIELSETVIFALSLHPMLIPDSLIKLKRLETVEELYKNYHIADSYSRSENIAFGRNAKAIISQSGELVCSSIFSFILSTGEKVIVVPKGYRANNRDMELNVICNKSISKDSIAEIRNAIEIESPLKGAIINVKKFDGIKMLKFKPKFNITDIPMDNALKRECASIEKLLKAYDGNGNGGIPFKRNVLISGIPGVGKTTITNGIISTALSNGCTVIMVDDQDDIDTAWNMAEELAPALIVLEDFDLMSGKRSVYSSSTVNSSLLNLLDGAKEIKGVLTLATTNRMEDIDEAAIRAGRINRHYNITYPTKNIKEKILSCHLEYYSIKKETLVKVNKLISHFISGDKITGAIIDSLALAIKQQETGEIVSEEEIRWIMNGLIYGNEKKFIL